MRPGAALALLSLLCLHTCFCEGSKRKRLHALDSFVENNGELTDCEWSQIGRGAFVV